MSAASWKAKADASQQARDRRTRVLTRARACFRNAAGTGLSLFSTARGTSRTSSMPTKGNVAWEETMRPSERVLHVLVRSRTCEPQAASTAGPETSWGYVPEAQTGQRPA